MAQNKKSGLFHGQCIDLTDEMDLRNVLNEDDDILILDTNRPMAELTTEIQNTLKAQNGPAESTINKKKTVSPTISVKKSAAPRVYKKILPQPDVNFAPGQVQSSPTSSNKGENKSPELTSKKQESQNPPWKAHLEHVKNSNSKDVCSLNKLDSIEPGGTNRTEPVQIGSVIIEPSDIVLAPSSSEIRNKKFPKDAKDPLGDASETPAPEKKYKEIPKDPLSDDTTVIQSDDDVIFIRNHGRKKLQVKPVDANLKQKGVPNAAPKKILAARTLEPTTGKLVQLLDDERMIGPSTVSPVKTPVPISAGKKNGNVVSQAGPKVNAPAPPNPAKNKGTNIVINNWLNTQIFQNKTQGTQGGSCEKRFVVSKVGVAPESKTPERMIAIQQVAPVNNKTKVMVPRGPQKAVSRPQQKIIDDDVICVTDLIQPTKNLAVRPNPSGTNRSETVVQSKNLNDVEKMIPSTNIVKSPVGERASKSVVKTPVGQALLHKALKLVTDVPDAVKKGAPGKITKVINRSVPMSKLPPYSMADVVETASAVANIIPNTNTEILADASKKGGSLVFLLCPVETETGAVKPFKEGQINQVLALVPSNSELAPAQLASLVPQQLAPRKEVTDKIKVFALNDDKMKVAKPEYVVSNLPLKKGKPEYIVPNPLSTQKEFIVRNPITTKKAPNEQPEFFISNPVTKKMKATPKDIEIEPSAMVTPVDIMQILNRGKKKQLPGRCKNNEELPNVFLKGFKKTKKSSCIVELKTIVKKEEVRINMMKKELKRYESNFVACDSFTNYFLPETVKTEEVTIECNDILEQVEDTETLPTITEVISKVNAEVFQLANKKAQRQKPSNMSKTEEALKLIKRGLEMIQSWSHDAETAQATEAERSRNQNPDATFCVPQGFAARRRGRPKRALQKDETTADIPIKRQRKKATGEDLKKQLTGGVSGVAKSLKVVNATDDDDLLVVKRVDIINSGKEPLKRGRRRKQTLL